MVTRCQRLEQENEELAASADVAKGVCVCVRGGGGRLACLFTALNVYSRPYLLCVTLNICACVVFVDSILIPMCVQVSPLISYFADDFFFLLLPMFFLVVTCLFFVCSLLPVELSFAVFND